MPDLPPLVGHLKADAGDWDTKMEMVAATGGEAASVIDILREAYDGARDAALEDAEANHMLRDATVESASATELLSHLLDVARDHALESAASNAWLARSLKELRDASAESAVAVEANSAAKTGNAAASAAATEAGFPLIGVLVGVGVAAGVAVLPIVALGVGLAGAVTALGLAVVGAGAFGAVAILVANATGQVNRQIAGLQHIAQQAANTLGKELAPIARSFITLLDQLIPIAVGLVGPIVAAFRDVMPIVMPFLKVLSVDLLRALQQVTLLAIDFFGAIAGRQAVFEPLFRFLLGVGVQALEGLLQNLVALSDWFFRTLPSLSGPTGGFFSLLGTLVQSAAAIIARFTEWVGQHWPEIARFFTESWREISAGFAYVSPVIGVAIAALQRLQPVIQFIKQHAEELKPILYAIGGAAAIMAASFLLTVGVVILIAGAFVGLFLIGDKVVNWLKVEVPAGIRAAGAAFSSLGAHVRGIQVWLSGSLAYARAWLVNLLVIAEEAWSQFASRPMYWVGFVLGWLNAKLNELLRNVTTWTLQMLERANAWANDMVRKADDLAVRFVTALAKEWRALPDQIWGWLSGVIPKVLAWAGDLVAKGAKAAVDFGTALAKEWQKLPDQMWTLGVNIVKGIIGGIGSMLNAAVKAAKDLINGIIDGANAAAGHPHSPAPATVPLGMALAQGVEAGVGHGAAGARAAMAGLVTSMTGGGAAGAWKSAPSAITAAAGAPRGPGMDRTNDLLAAQNGLLQQIRDALQSQPFSNRAYRPT